MIGYVFGLAALCFILERVMPGWPLPKVRSWPFRVIIINCFQLAVILLAGVSWERWLSSWSLFRLGQSVPPAVGGFIAYLIGTFVFYWWHRWRHQVDFLWRAFHQIHHSPQRIEVITSFYKHPFEMIANSIIGSSIVYTFLGLDLHGGAAFTFFCAAGEFFYHTNIRTAHWIGYFFQRPEMHRIHHQYDRHKNNYGDITWWDMLFGTYENPKEFTSTCGFDPAKEEQLAPMIAFRDVHSEIK
jgi:sterol desaturase/sphingolipid hydroxylase (fatty acid hydroxylase superfamily)